MGNQDAKMSYEKIVFNFLRFVYNSCKPVLTTVKLLTNTHLFLSTEVLVPVLFSRESLKLITKTKIY